MPFGWSDEPLYTEQKIVNLFYTVDHALDTLQKAHKLDNKLKTSEFAGLEFNEVHGYRVALKWVPEHLKQIPHDGLRSHLCGRDSWGYWMIYSDRIGSLGDERHKWPVWDAHQLRYEPLPKGLRTRTMPRDYLGENFGELNPRQVREDHLIAATIDKNKWRPGPHNKIPPSLSKLFKK